VKYIKVALNLPLNQLFYYKVPPELTDRIKIGKRVIVPFKRKNLTGFVIEETKRGKPGKRLKEIIKVDDFPFLDTNLLRLGEWISDYYFCSLGQTLHFMLPIQSSLKIGKEEKIKISDSFAFFNKTQYNEAISLVEEGNFLFRPKNNEEKISFYLLLIEKIVEEKGKNVILIIPEISYIPFLKRVIRYYFPQEIAIFHSRLSLKEKYNQWLKMREGKVNLAIGTRSLIFAPFPQIGLVIIEEEENTSYKQIEAPRYHVREVAIKRREIERFPLILTTQSPSLESWYNVKKGNYKLIELSQNSRRFLVEIVDLREEKTKILSSSLEEGIKESLNKNKLVLLFINKRGFANFILCKECGGVIRCPNCNIGLTFHLGDDLVCHYCNYRTRVPRICPFCKGRELRRVGAGTQRVEREIRKKFQTARIKRVDKDAINSSSAYKKLLQDLEDKKIDILVGTQLVIKEEILKRIDLVGIVLVDTLLNLPDFRATERLFQLLTRIKGHIKERGKIIIQTYNPSHYALKAFKEGKDEDFYNEEMRIRKELDYPPYLHWIRILLEGKIKSEVEEAGKMIEEKLKKESLRFLGPSSCPFSKIRGKYRYHLILRDEDLSWIKKILDEKLKPLFTHFKGIRTTVDVEPLRTM